MVKVYHSFERGSKNMLSAKRTHVS